MGGGWVGPKDDCLLVSLRVEGSAYAELAIAVLHLKKSGQNCQCNVRIKMPNS